MARRPGRRQSDEGVRFPWPLTGICVLIAAILLWLDRPESRIDPLSEARASFNDAALPLLTLAGQPLRGLENMGPWWRRQLQLAEENRALRLRAAELRMEADRRLRIEAPDYREIPVSLSAVLTRGAVLDEVIKALNEAYAGFLMPLTGGPEGKGWEFAAMVKAGDVSAALADTPGIAHIETLTLDEGRAHVQCGWNGLPTAGALTLEALRADTV